MGSRRRLDGMSAIPNVRIGRGARLSPGALQFRNHPTSSSFYFGEVTRAVPRDVGVIAGSRDDRRGY